MIKKIFTAIVCSSLVFGTLGCGFTEGVKQGYEEATENNSTDNKSEDTQEKDNNKDSAQKETTTNNQEYKSIRDIHTAKVYSGTNKEIGTRAYAQYDPDSLSDEELIKFYNEKIKDSGYSYFTLINIKDNTKGIVFSGCGNMGDKCSIDETGSSTNSEELLEIKENEIKHIK